MTDTERLFHRMSLYVRRALNIPCPPGWAFPSRYSYDYEILYVQSGTLYMQVDGVEYSGHPGDLFFLPPGVAHVHRNAGEDTLLSPHSHFDW